MPPHFPLDDVDLMVRDDDLSLSYDPISEAYPGGSEIPPDPAAFGGLTGTGQLITSPVSPFSEPFPIERLNEEFLVFDDIGMQGQPDLVTDYGLQPLQRFTHWYFFNPNLPITANTEPDLARIADFASIIDPSQLFVINIEAWKNVGTPEVVQATIDRFHAVIDTIRDVNPELVIGIYLMLPVRDYWTPVGQAYDSPLHDDWEARSAALAELAELVDVILPSVYTFYADYNDPSKPYLDDPNDPRYVDRTLERGRWQLYAQKNLQMAQSYGKPVISYIWPYYHGGGGSADPNDADYRYWKFKPIGGEFWNVILETTREYSDGTIIWTGTDPWDESNEWWTETQAFMETVASTKPSIETTISGVITAGDLNDVVTDNLPQVSIEVLHQNRAPVAQDDDVALAGASVAFNVFANNGHGVDSDADHAIVPSSIQILSSVSFGTLTGSNGDYTYAKGPNFPVSGTDSFVYTITDPDGAVSNSATVRIRAPQAPVAINDLISLNEDTSKIISVIENNGLGADYDPDGTIGGSVLTTTVSGVSNGVLTHFGGSSYHYQPNPNFHGTDSFTYQITNSSGLVSNVATVTFTVLSVNDRPVAKNDSVSIAEDIPTLINVLANNGNGPDTDIDGSIVAIELLTQPTLGAATVVGNQVQYTPHVNAFGSDQFQYRVKDDQNLWSLPATVTITINEINDVPLAANDDLLVPKNVAVQINLVANNGHGPDSDVDGTLTLGSSVIVVPPAHGSLSRFNPSGDTFIYTPNANFVGSDSFEYTITDDDNGVSLNAIVSISILANVPPKAIDDEFTMVEEGSLEFNVLIDNGNGADVDLDGVLIPSSVVWTPPSDGVLTDLGNGNFRYEPAVDFVGTVTFPYTVKDDGDNLGNNVATSNPGIVTIHVTNTNDAPVAVDDVVVVAEDTPQAINVFADNQNGPDTDIDGPLTGSTVNVTAPNAGTAIVTSEGIVTYTPPPNFFGSNVSFNYTITDSGNLTSNTATVTIEVSPVNDPPLAQPRTTSTVEDTSVTLNVFTHPGVAITDVDSLINFSSAGIATQPANGQVVHLGGGEFQYTPHQDFVGSDVFSYRVADVEGAVSLPANVNVNVSAVNDNPVAVADAATTPPSTPVTIQVLADNGSGPDYDVDGTIPAPSVSINLTPSNGTVQLVGATAIRYTPNGGFFGTDSFSYRLSDGSGGISDPAIVTVVVNSPPSAVNDSITTDEDVAVTINVLQANGNAADSDAEQVLTAANVTFVTMPNHGTLATAGVNGWLYTPAAEFSGTDSWTYRLTDSFGATSNLATVSVTINHANDRPVAIADTIVVPTDLWREFNVLRNNEQGVDFDIDSQIDKSTVAVSQNPQHGLVVRLQDGRLRYTPDSGFIGTDTFTYTVKDMEGSESLPSTVTLNVVPPNFAPLARNDVRSTSEATAVLLDVFADNGSGFDRDADGTLVPASIFQVKWPRSGTLSNFKDGRFRYTPKSGFFGTDRFTYFVLDNDGRPGHVYESLSESGGALEHHWTFALNDHTAKVFSVRGYHESQTEGFEFEYSTDGSVWLPMNLSLRNTVARHAFNFPAGITGNITVRVMDSDANSGDLNVDEIHIDHMYIATDAPAPTGLPELTISDATIIEPTPGQRYAEFVVTRTGDSSASTTYTYETLAGTAVGGEDFTALPKRIALMQKGESVQTIRVAIAADSELTPEGPESFQVVLSRPVGGAFGDASGSATIPEHDVARVLQRQIFYNGSPIDDAYKIGNSGAHAIATDKSALTRGHTATYANYTNYQHGITGILLEIENAAAPTGLSASDFQFFVGNDDTPDDWPALTTSPVVTVNTTGSAPAVSTVSLTWPSDTIMNTWLRVEVLATSATGLVTPDEFFLGHLTGETGNSTTRADTDSSDLQRVFGAMSPSPATILSTTDINRDGKTDFQDVQAIYSNFFGSLELISLQSNPTAARSTLIDLPEDRLTLISSTLEPIWDVNRRLAEKLNAVDEILADESLRYDRFV